MDDISMTILEIVSEHNAKGIGIYRKKLVDILKKEASPPTISKKINELVQNGELFFEYVGMKHGTPKMLFVKKIEKIIEKETGESETEILKLLLDNQCIMMMEIELVKSLISKFMVRKK